MGVVQSPDGYLKAHELHVLVDNPEVRNYLEVMGIDIKDTGHLVQLATPGLEGSDVLIDDFITGCMKLKGEAMSLDLRTLLCEVRLRERSDDKRYQALAHMLNEVRELVSRGTIEKEELHPCLLKTRRN